MRPLYRSRWSLGAQRIKSCTIVQIENEVHEIVRYEVGRHLRVPAFVRPLIDGGHSRGTTLQMWLYIEDEMHVVTDQMVRQVCKIGRSTLPRCLCLNPFPDTSLVLVKVVLLPSATPRNNPMSPMMSKAATKSDPFLLLQEVSCG